MNYWFDIVRFARREQWDMAGFVFGEMWCWADMNAMYSHAVSDSLYALASSQALALALSGNLIDEKIHTLPLSPVGLRRCALCVAP